MTLKGIRSRFQFHIVHKSFNTIGTNAYIFDPLQIDNPGSISIGFNTYIAAQSWLMGGVGSAVTLKIGDNVQIGHFAHIIGMHSVEICDGVLLADKVYIADTEHCYKDISKPVLEQGTTYVGDVKIGEGSWLGENVCVIGANIGKHCIIGANAVVTKDIPDYSIAVGIPAQVIKRYDFNKEEWVKVEGGK